MVHRDLIVFRIQVEPRNAARLTTNYDATRVTASAASSPGVDASAPPGFRVTDAAASSAWLGKPSLLAGGGGIVSTARDFFRYGGMSSGAGVFEVARVMKPETARLALSDLTPPGVANPSEKLGSGNSSMLLRHPITPPGTFGGSGAASTLFWIDPPRRGIVVFMTQAMWEGGHSNVPYWRRLIAAIEGTLKS